MTTRAVADAIDELHALTADPDPTLRSIATAIRRTVTGELDVGERSWLQRIEALRAEVDASTELIDTALTNTRGVEKPLPLGETAHRRSKKDVWALVLLMLVRELRPRHTLELGTCIGISGAFLAAGFALNGEGRVVTLEGAPALARLAADHFERLGLGEVEVEVVPGLFRATLPTVLERSDPIDLAFIDGHHDEHATQEYFEQLLPHLTRDGVVVFDDIRWSDGMARAWTALCDHSSIRVAVDLDRIGICIIGVRDRPRTICLPRLTAMAHAHRSTR